MHSQMTTNNSRTDLIKIPALSPEAVNDMLDVSKMTDEDIMLRVLGLAALGVNTTQPNPKVGCVIVNDGKIVGQGFHHSAGQLHAERNALEQAGDKARGATAYVSLEPCCHQGRTPPCTDGLIDAGVTHVVAAMGDPNPLVRGGGFDLLKSAGIEVKTGVCEKQARWLNRGFVSRMKRRKPWVTLKSAATLDGRTAAFDGQSKWITGDDARGQVQSLRAASSAVITGIGTVLADDPQLNVRQSEGDQTPRQPLRVVLDSKLQIPLETSIAGNDQKLVIFTLSNDLDKISALIEVGAEVIQHKDDGSGQLNLEQVLNDLAKWQCNEVLVEAGQTLSGAFLESGLVDELVLFYAGSLLGDQGKSMFKFNAPLPFSNRVKYSVNDVNMIGSDIRVDAVSQSSLEQITEV